MRPASESLVLAVLLFTMPSAFSQETRNDEEQAIRDLDQAVEATVDRADTPGRPVVAVAIHSRKPITDRALAALRHLPHLRRLVLRGTAVTDAGLACLTGLKELRRLDLAETRVSDAGLAHLKGLVKLERLDLSQTRVRGPGLAHLAGLAELRILDLQKTQVGTHDLQRLGSSKHLRWVDVTDTEVKLWQLGGGGTAGRYDLRAHGQKVQLYDTRTGKDVGAELVHEIQRPAEISESDFSRDKHWVVTAASYRLMQRSGNESMGEIRVWEVPTGRPVATYRGRSLGWVHGVVFGRDSKTVFFQAAQFEIDGP